MEKEQSVFDIKYIIDILLRRRWFILIPFCLVMAVGIVLALILPKTYEASTLILVQPPSVPEEFVREIVSTDIEDRISTLSQQILSRTNLEKLITNLNLFTGPDHSESFMEDKIALLRERISVKTTSSSKSRRSTTNAFTLSYRGKRPDQVMQVVNTLSTYFIDENMKSREKQALGTSSFLEDQLIATRKRLEEVEELLKVYRKTHMGELPEQLDSNLRILDRLQDNLNDRQQSLRDAKNRLVALKNIISENRRTQTTNIYTGNGVTAKEAEPTNIDQLKERLEYLKTRYTERHPDFIRLKNTIQKMEEAATGSNSLAANNSSSKVLSLEERRQMQEINAEIRSTTEDISKIGSEIAYYQRKVENTPKREQELLSLKRDYENVQASYNSILERKLEAEMAVNMERKQKGEQFRILDPAKRPERPIEPDPKKLFLLTVALGLGLGGGIVFLLEFMDKSFRKLDDVESYLGIPVIGVMPEITSTGNNTKFLLNSGFSIVFITGSFLLLLCLAAVTLLGWNPFN